MPENDLFESFTTMDQTHLHPLPASEVRRRGDRLRRRNTALAVAGGTVAAMTAIGAPLALTQGGGADRDSLPIATDGPSPDAVQWRTSIPEDFPLTEGMPTTNVLSGTPVETREGYEPQAPGPCGGPAWDVSGALDSLQAIFQDTEGGVDRTVSAFPDDASAGARLDELSERARSCDSRQIRVAWVEQDLGDQSVVFADVWDDGTAYLHQAVRVGNAVLYTTAYFNGGGDPDVVERTWRQAEQDTADVVSAMCVFSADPC